MFRTYNSFVPTNFIFISTLCLLNYNARDRSLMRRRGSVFRKVPFFILELHYSYLKSLCSIQKFWTRMQWTTLLRSRACEILLTKLWKTSDFCQPLNFSFGEKGQYDNIKYNQLESKFKRNKSFDDSHSQKHEEKASKASGKGICHNKLSL